MLKFFVILFLFSSLMFAQEGKKMSQEGAGKDKDSYIKSLKQQEEVLNKRLAEVRDAISCSEKAADEGAERKCRQDFRAKRKSSRKDLEEKMNEMKTKRDAKKNKSDQ